MPTVSPLARMAEVAADPDAYALAWKQAHPGGKVAGVLPMNFPEELLHAAGFLRSSSRRTASRTRRGGSSWPSSIAATRATWPIRRSRASSRTTTPTSSPTTASSSSGPPTNALCAARDPDLLRPVHRIHERVLDQRQGPWRDGTHRERG